MKLRRFIYQVTKRKLDVNGNSRNIVRVWEITEARNVFPLARFVGEDRRVDTRGSHQAAQQIIIDKLALGPCECIVSELTSPELRSPRKVRT